MYLEELSAMIRANIPLAVDIPPGSENLFILYAVLARVKGCDVTDEDVHDAWVAWMLSRGERHDAMVPFSTLDETAQAQDAPFAEAIRRAAAELGT